MPSVKVTYVGCFAMSVDLKVGCMFAWHRFSVGFVLFAVGRPLAVCWM